MKRFVRLVILLLPAAAAGCGGGRAAAPASPSAVAPASTATWTAAPPSATPSPSPTALPLPSATPRPTVSPAPTATAETAVAGLPCPTSPPTRPDYAPYTLTTDPWPTPNPTAPLPPLSLADPLPGSERNDGYPYGSDGNGRYLLHNGLDMAPVAGNDEEAPAVAPFDGTVILARDDLDEVFGWRCDWYGELVVIRADETHDDQPVYVLFGHVRDVMVSEGQRVARGEPVAREGTAGAAVVPHLHMEVRVGENAFGATRNPLLWLEPPAGSGVIAGRLLAPDGRAWQGVTVTLIDPRGELPFVNSWTYLDDPDHLIRPDPALGENFVFGPVAVGTYDVYTQVGGVEYRRPVTVEDRAITTLEIITEP